MRLSGYHGSIATRTLSIGTIGKLFGVGATVGPIVDSLHNQVLLRYGYAPISIVFPDFLPISSSRDDSLLLATSWVVPPLLGIAYVVLGGILPRLMHGAINKLMNVAEKTDNNDCNYQMDESNFRNRAFIAVVTTAAIVKLSEFLVVNPAVTDFLPGRDYAVQHFVILILAALVQWAILDGTLESLLTASIASIGGPLSELPFVAAMFWHYLPLAGDYQPLQGVAADSVPGVLLSSLLGPDYSTLALSSITGPCYFAVTMDAIALGRWFDSQLNEPIAPTETASP